MPWVQYSSSANSSSNVNSRRADKLIQAPSDIHMKSKSQMSSLIRITWNHEAEQTRAKAIAQAKFLPSTCSECWPKVPRGSVWLWRSYWDFFRSIWRTERSKFHSNLLCLRSPPKSVGPISFFSFLYSWTTISYGSFKHDALTGYYTNKQHSVEVCREIDLPISFSEESDYFP